MTSNNVTAKNQGSLHTNRSAGAFVLLLFLYAGAAMLSYFASPFFFSERYYISCPIPTDSVYGILSALTLSLKGTICQVILILISAFTFFPLWISAAAVSLRGICTGCALYAISNGMVSGLNAAEGALSLYFLSSVLLILLSSCAYTCSELLFVMRSRQERKNIHALLYSYFRTFAFMSGGIFVISGFAIIFC